MKTIAQNESGRWTRDDAQLRDSLIATLGIVKRIGCAWEQFPDLTAEERRGKFDQIYRDISALITELEQVDKRKGGGHA